MTGGSSSPETGSDAPQMPSRALKRQSGHMSEEAQRIAIAEVCGLTFRAPMGGIDWEGDLPDYLHDLNACHEMEKVLKRHEWTPYIDAILDRDKSEAPYEYQVCLQASPVQRCEAFLCVKGLWQ